MTSLPIEEAVARYAELTQRLNDLKEQADFCKDIILGHFNEEPGEEIQIIDDNRVIVAIPEKWTWDQDCLEQIVDEDEMPDFVTNKLSVDKRKFTALEPEQREEYLSALTRSPGTPRIKIEKVD